MGSGFWGSPGILPPAIFRQFSLTYSELKERISLIENQFPDIYKALNYLVEKDNVKENNNKRNKIGYKK